MANDIMKLSDYNYELPKELIAQSAAEPRDSSRLMLVNRGTNEVTHHIFSDLLEHLQEGDVMVFNNSRVIHARLRGHRSSGGAIELLLLKNISSGIWEALVRPGRRMKSNTKFTVVSPDGQRQVNGTIKSVQHNGSRIVELEDDSRLDEIGILPLPPYIQADLTDSERYQTIYAVNEGSIAAPTAGLHFTTDLMGKIRDHGVETVFVTLHVGWDSFRPIKNNDLTSHEMHSEFFHISKSAAERITLAKSQNRRVISVGTTAVRLLEHLGTQCQYSDSSPVLHEMSGHTNLFINPGFQFKLVDALITNFHLPQSTLLMLTSAMAGSALLRKSYEIAVDQKYRFYSFGDAMFII